MPAIAVLLALLSVFADRAATPVAADVYRVTDLGTLGGTDSGARAINAAGQVVGWWSPAGPGSEGGFLYDSAGMRDLGPPGSHANRIMGINDRGQVIGQSDAAGLGAFLMDTTGVDPPVALGDLGGYGALPTGINNAGQVTGWSYILHAGERAFRWEAGRMANLGTLGGLYSIAAGINDSGQVVGTATTTGGARSVDNHAFLYDQSGMHDLGALGGGFSAAFAINAAGQVVGQAAIPGDIADHAFLFDQTGKYDLGTLGGTYSVAHALNNTGWVVGSSYTPADTYETRHAFLFSSGVLRDLNSLIPAGSGLVLVDAFGINDSGQIVGWAAVGGHTHAYLLTPRRPAAPDGLAATALSSTTVGLSWTDHSDNETGYGIWRRSGSDDWVRIGVAPGQGTRFLDSGLAPNTPYTYRVRAHNDLFASDWSGEASATTLAAPP